MTDSATQLFNKIRLADAEKSKQLLSAQLSINLEKPGTSSSSDEDAHFCEICTDPIEIFAIGKCNHPICFICCIRLRLKCNEEHCPTCREKLEDVYLDYTLKDFSKFSKRSSTYVAKFNVFLPKYDDTIYGKIQNLLSFTCLEEDCFESSDHVKKGSHKRDRPPGFEDPVGKNETESAENSSETQNKTESRPRKPLKFHTLQKWQIHQSKQHKRSPCNLCVENQALFCHEIQLYTPKERAIHVKQEHPVCQFCDVRYYDQAAELRHLRQDHEYCRLCENLTQGASIVYYDKFKDLRVHLEAEHFYCHHPDCNKNEREYSVFKTEMELEIHTKKDHAGDKLGRTQIIGIDEEVQPRNRNRASQYYYNSDVNRRNRGENTRDNNNTSHVNATGDSRNRSSNQDQITLTREQEYPEQRDPSIIPSELNEALNPSFEPTEESFPTLGGQATNNSAAPASDFRKKGYNPMASENFPTLGEQIISEAQSKTERNQEMRRKAQENKKKQQQLADSAGKQQPKPEQYPSLPSSSKNSSQTKPPAKKVQELSAFQPKTRPSKTVSSQPNQTTQNSQPPKAEAFPSLGGGKGSSNLTNLMKKNPKSIAGTNVIPLHLQKKQSAKKVANTHLSLNSSKKQQNKNKKSTKTDDDWWDEPTTSSDFDLKKYGIKNYNQNASNTSSGGLINGLHPLAAPMTSKKEEPNTDFREDSNSKNKAKLNLAAAGSKKAEMEFPTLGGSSKTGAKTKSIGKFYPVSQSGAAVPKNNSSNTVFTISNSSKKSTPKKKVAQPKMNVITPAAKWLEQPNVKMIPETQPSTPNPPATLEDLDFGPSLQSQKSGQSGLGRHFKTTSQIEKQKSREENALPAGLAVRMKKTGKKR